MKYQKHEGREMLWSRKAPLLHILVRWALSTNLQKAPSMKYFWECLKLFFACYWKNALRYIKPNLIVCWGVKQTVLGAALRCPYLSLRGHKYCFWEYKECLLLVKSIFLTLSCRAMPSYSQVLPNPPLKEVFLVLLASSKQGLGLGELEVNEECGEFRF